MAKPVIIRTFYNPNDAYVAKCFLEDAGIVAYLYDQYAPSTIPSPSSGTKLVVADVDSAKAIQLLETEFISSDSESLPPELIEDDEPIVCPKCSSKRILNDPSFLPFWYIILRILLLLIIIFTVPGKKRQWYKCRDCKHVWRE